MVRQMRLKIPAREPRRILRTSGFILVGDEKFPGHGPGTGLDPNLPVNILLGESQMITLYPIDRMLADYEPRLHLLDQHAVRVRVDEVRDRHGEAVLLDDEIDSRGQRP